MKETETISSETSEHEGSILRNYIKRSGKTQDEFSAFLGMTRQNLSHHMRKPVLDDDFRRLLKEKGISLYSDNKLQSDSEEIPYNIPLKKNRMAKVILPKGAKALDVDLIISHLKLMKGAMD